MEISSDAPTETLCPLPCLAGAEGRLGGIQGPQLLAAQALECVAARCHGWPTEAILSQRSEIVPLLSACRNHTVLTKPDEGGVNYARLYPASEGGATRTMGCPGSAPGAGSWRCSSARRSGFIRQNLSENCVFVFRRCLHLQSLHILQENLVLP